MSNLIAEEIGQLYQYILEKSFKNFPSGTCYLAGYCLSEYFKRLGFESKSVTGSLALIDKKEKYIVYGNLNIPKSSRIGLYHTWCEIFIDDEWYILDVSLKYNKVVLKSFGANLSPKIPDILFTKEKNTFIWKYVPNENLVKESDYFLEKVPDEIKNGIVETLLKNTNI
jgi:hypothetical protein